MSAHWIAPRRIGNALNDGRAYREAERICRASPDIHETRHYRIEDEADIRWIVLGLALVPWVAIVATLVL